MVIMPIFSPPYINLKPNLCMKLNINIYVIFSILKQEIDQIKKPEKLL